MGSPTNAEAAGGTVSQSVAGGSPLPRSAIDMRDGRTFAASVTGTMAAYVPDSIRPREVPIGSPPDPDAATSTSAPSFHLPAWIDAADSSATTVIVVPEIAA